MAYTYASISKHECFSLLFWIKTFYPIVFFSSLVYSTILFLNLCGVYGLKKDNPMIIVGYISLIHLFSYPLFMIGLNGNAVCLFIFPYINLVWIVAMIIGHFVIHTFFVDLTAQLISSPLHYHFLIVYVVSAILLEIMMMIFKTQEMKKVSAFAFDTQESDERGLEKGNPGDRAIIQKPENQFRTITIVNDNPPIDEYMRETYKDAFKTKQVSAKQSPSNVKELTTTNLIDTQNNIRNILNKKK